MAAKMYAQFPSKSSNLIKAYNSCRSTYSKYFDYNFYDFSSGSFSQVFSVFIFFASVSFCKLRFVTFLNAGYKVVIFI